MTAFRVSFYKQSGARGVLVCVSFSLRLFVFCGLPDPRSARAGAIETQFLMFDVAFKGASFLIACWKHFWYIWRRNPAKRHFKIELENKSCKSVFCLLSCSFGHPFGHLMGRLFVPLGRECRQKGKVFSRLGPWTRKRWCLTLSGATGAPEILCFLESGA